MVKAQDACVFFKQSGITWYGIDFSRVKMIGPGFNNPNDIKMNYFTSWNNLILNESEKFNLYNFLHKTKVDYNLELVTKSNSLVDETKMVTYNSVTTPLEEVDLSNIVAGYDFGDVEGYGTLLVVESFNKIEQKGTFYIVFFDIKTKKVLVTKQLSGMARGVGLRNYWAGSIYEALKKCGRSYYRWESEVCKKNK